MVQHAYTELALIKGRNKQNTGLDTINGIEVFLRLIVKFLGLLLEFLEPTFGIAVDGILGMFADVELGLERLGRSYDALLEAFETHVGVTDPLGLLHT